jgi:hypothetical protein
LRRLKGPCCVANVAFLMNLTKKSVQVESLLVASLILVVLFLNGCVDVVGRPLKVSSGNIDRVKSRLREVLKMQPFPEHALSILKIGLPLPSPIR